jgi:hypothetical protein
MIKKHNQPDVNNAFPVTDEYYDYADNKRIFEINSQHSLNGWFLTATEQQAAEHGYEINAFSETSPYLALGEIRKKIRKALSVKYLDLSGNSVTLTHEKMYGSLIYDRESESHGLLVDGRFLSMDEFERILSGYEGWEFDFSIHEI